jgi:hypothetical protein
LEDHPGGPDAFTPVAGKMDSIFVPHHILSMAQIRPFLTHHHSSSHFVNTVVYSGGDATAEFEDVGNTILSGNNDMMANERMISFVGLPFGYSSFNVTGLVHWSLRSNNLLPVLRCCH